MKKNLVAFFIFCTVATGYSQDTSSAIVPVTNVTDTKSAPSSGLTGQDNLSIHFAQTYSRFRFRNSEGGKDSALGYDFRSSYGINYCKFFTPEIFIRPELGYKNLGAVSILNDQKLEWSLHYLDLNAGGGYQMKFGNLQPYAGLSLYVSYLYKATQSLGAYYYDMIENKGIKRLDFGVNLFGGAKYALSKTNSLFIEIRNSTGMQQLETNAVEGQSQKLYNRAVSFHFGVSFNISKDAATPATERSEI